MSSEAPTTRPRPRRRWKIAAVLAAIVALPAGWFGLRFGYEHADYEVVEKHEQFEVRAYAPRIVAEVTVDAPTERAATRRGFGLLADYIFGNNIASESIAMTTPVETNRSTTIAMTTPVETAGDEGSYTVRFTMPAEYRLADLPRPIDPRVLLVQLPAKRFAAARVAGAPGVDVVQRHMRELKSAVDAAGMSPSGPTTYAQYDPPWTPGFLKRNEVLVPLGT